jgi:hypothetical protein
VHRSVVVNLRAISHVKRGLNETADIHLKGRDEVLPVSRSYLHLFVRCDRRAANRDDPSDRSAGMAEATCFYRR